MIHVEPLAQPLACRRCLADGRWGLRAGSGSLPLWLQWGSSPGLPYVCWLLQPPQSLAGTFLWEETLSWFLFLFSGAGDQTQGLAYSRLVFNF
jgi:hypothetical protein